MFNIGDEVKIINTGNIYSKYLEMAVMLSASYKWQYGYGYSPPGEKIGRILNFRRHPTGNDTVYLVYIPSLDREILIGELGIQLKKKKVKRSKMLALYKEFSQNGF